tara:strand:+ start:2405 stop:3379 length:975 start_codon:yes stop_codon:yes gene_type:complete
VNNPLITVGLTTYNSAATVYKALLSIKLQDWSPLEIVIVDDASSDNTLQILDDHIKDFNEVKLIINEVNSGVAVSRNKILSEASGEFVIFFDDDDESMPNRITEQYLRIVEYERDFALGSPVICHTARQVVYPDGKIILQPAVGEQKNIAAPSGMAFIKRALIGLPVKNSYGSTATCSQMARLSTYHLVGNFDPNLRRGEDTDLCIRLAERGGHFVGISSPLVIQTMTKTLEKNLDEELKVYQYLINKHRNIIEKYSSYDFVVEFYNLRNAWYTEKWVTFFKQLCFLIFRYPFLTMQRLILALQNISIHKAFKDFHKIEKHKID